MLSHAVLPDPVRWSIKGSPVSPDGGRIRVVSDVQPPPRQGQAARYSSTLVFNALVSRDAGILLLGA